MLDEPNRASKEETVIYEADFGLKRKLGGWESLANVLTPQVIVEAEKTVAALQPDLLAQILADVERLKVDAQKITQESLPLIVETAFAIKSRAGFCNYPLASAMAKSLHVFCEILPRDRPLTPKEVETVHCLVSGLTTVFRQHVTGKGGKTGQEILAELDHLAARF